MFEQLMIAYLIGMIVAVSIEVGRITKARRMKRRAIEAGIMAPQAAPTFRSVRTASSTSPTAANEGDAVPVMRAAG